MSTNVYNIIWADDDIDALKDRYEKRFTKNGLSIIGIAHNGDTVYLKSLPDDSESNNLASLPTIRADKFMS